MSAYRHPSNQSMITFPSPENNVMNKGDVNKKVLKHFNKTFRNAENIKWSQLNDNFLAAFTKDDIATKSLFNKKGHLIYSIDYFSEKELPANIKNIVAGNYRHYAITSVARIQQDNQKIWIVKLANKANYISVRIKNEDVDEIENFHKAN